MHQYLRRNVQLLNIHKENIWTMQLMSNVCWLLSEDQTFDTAILLWLGRAVEKDAAQKQNMQHVCWSTHR